MRHQVGIGGPDSWITSVMSTRSHIKLRRAVINSTSWQWRHWCSRRDSCVLCWWTAGVQRRLVTRQPFTGVCDEDRRGNARTARLCQDPHTYFLCLFFLASNITPCLNVLARVTEFFRNSKAQLCKCKTQNIIPSSHHWDLFSMG